MNVRISPDGQRYLAMADGHRVPRPFHYRWLLPALLGTSSRAWVTANVVAAVVLVATAAAWAHLETDGWEPAVIAALVVLSLPGVVDIARRFPVLVDLVAMALAFTAAFAVHVGWWPVAIPLALLAGATKETSPVFAALFCLNPIPLVGLVPVAIRHLQKPGREPDGVNPSAIAAAAWPYKTSRTFRKGSLRDFESWVGPWGVALLGFWWPPAWPALVVAYSQCLVATDRVRLYQWAGPIVAVGVATTLPADWRLIPLVALLCWFRPWPSDGV